MSEKREWLKAPRVGRRSLPNTVTVCERHKCKYNNDGKCPAPRAFKQMEYAACKTVANKVLLKELTEK